MTNVVTSFDHYYVTQGHEIESTLFSGNFIFVQNDCSSVYHRALYASLKQILGAFKKEDFGAMTSLCNGSCMSVPNSRY